MAAGNLWIWEEAECKALQKALAEFNRSAPPANRITQRKLAEAIGASTATVNTFLRGRRALNAAIALAFQKASGVPVRSFSPRLADEIEAAECLKD